MKTRNGFVSNSSSTSFMITNKTNRTLTLVDFVEENPQLIEQFCDQYDWHTEESGYTQERLLESARGECVDMPPGTHEYVFGDEQGTLVGAVFDYILRDGGESKSFKWRFNEYYR